MTMQYPIDFINKTICGDCLKVMEDIPEKSVDMILCDLPYGITRCAWDIVIPLDNLWAAYCRIIKDNGVIVLTAVQPFTSKLITSNLAMFKYEWIWKKNEGSGFATSKYRPMRYHENIIVFSKGKGTYNPQKTLRLSKESQRVCGYDVGVGNSKALRAHGAMKSPGMVKYDPLFKMPESIIDIKCVPNGGGKKLHPTQKPVLLFEYLIRTYTNEDDLVLDNCAGSGTTGIACQNTKRNFILIEKEIGYCDIINTRTNHKELL